VVKGLGDAPGILPVVDADLGDGDEPGGAPWLAMPIARPIADALADKDLETVVDAVAAIAETLARLGAEYGIAHRDLKPANLYELNGQWLVGDFGLVAVPDLDALTRGGKPVGPVHFTASEVIVGEEGIDWERADVYSLAKVLWCLATGNPNPPEGHQDASNPYTVAAMRPHGGAHALDVLIQRATQLAPAVRPQISEFATELRRWQTLGATVRTIDVASHRERIMRGARTELDAEALRQRLREEFFASIRRLAELTRPINEAVAELGLPHEIDTTGDRYAQNMLDAMVRYSRRETIDSWQRTTRVIAPGARSGSHAYTIRVSRMMALTAEGLLVVSGHVVVGMEGVSGSDYSAPSPRGEAPVGTIEADGMLIDFGNELTAQFEEGLEVFTARLERRSA
jgi:hypothetical protein